MSNRSTFLRFLDAVNTGDPEVTSKVIDEIVEPDVLFRASVPTGATGAEALKQVWGTLLRAFPDLHVTVSDLIDAGDKVVARHTVRGTHPSTGQRVTSTEILAARFADGRIAEVWGLYDAWRISPVNGDGHHGGGQGRDGSEADEEPAEEPAQPFLQVSHLVPGKRDVLLDSQFEVPQLWPHSHHVCSWEHDREQGDERGSQQLPRR